MRKRSIFNPPLVEPAHAPTIISNSSITFSYNKKPTIRHIHLEVSPGQTVALLGSPGSGKTTLMHLLARFYDVDQGRILIDGIDIRDATLDSLRQTVGVIQQDVFLFSAKGSHRVEGHSTDIGVKPGYPESHVREHP